MNSITLTRDPLGLVPMYYAIYDHKLLFGSSLSDILETPGFKPEITIESLNELFSMGPAHSMGHTAFSNIYEVIPGHRITYDESGLHDEVYHRFEIREHTDSYEDTLDHVKQLFTNSIAKCKTQCAVSGEPAASLLSGGIDSSYVTSLVQDVTKDTYSFEFEDQAKHFTGSAFQPSLDEPYVNLMVDALGTNHQVLYCDSSNQVDALYLSVDAHCLPAMGDIDSSLCYFLSKIKGKHHFIFTGECADELFAGYPWYHQTQLQSMMDFPWSYDYETRLQLLDKDFRKKLHAKEYCRQEYTRACQDIGLPAAHTPYEYLHKKTFYLTLRYFMTTLIDRTNCAAAANNLTALVPFADTSLAEYLFNVPYEMKTRDGQIKHLLRACAKGSVPDTVRLRRKSPYPKTYDPGYEALLVNEFDKMLQNSDSPILEFLDLRRTVDFFESPKDLSMPWFGQLMAGPQLLAYYLQINYWLEKYQPLYRL